MLIFDYTLLSRGLYIDIHWSNFLVFFISECHRKCKSCNGPNHNQCTSCTNSAQVVFLGECLNNCPDNFFIRGGNCIGKILSLLMDPTITSVPPVLTQLRLCSWENVSIIVLITSSSEEETVLVRFYHC